MLSQLGDKDVVRQLKSLNKFSLNLAEYPNTEARARKRVPKNHFARQAEFETDLPDFVFKQFAQWLDQRHAHIIGQAADVVVRLDNLCLARGRTGRFDDVGIYSSLREPFDVFEFLCLFVKYLDKHAADDFAFVFRIRLTRKRIKESIRRIYTNHFDTEMLGERPHNLVTFVVAEKSVVDEYTSQLIANRFVQQCRNHRRIHATRQAEQNLPVANAFANIHDRICDNIAGRPVAGTAANVMHETVENLLPLQRVCHFGVKLHAVQVPLSILHRGHRRVLALRRNRKAGRHRLDSVTVTHPDFQLRLRAITIAQPIQ